MCVYWICWQVGHFGRQGYIPEANRSPGTVCLEFSHDQRFLMQQSKLEDAAFPNVWGRNHGMQTIHVWDVAKGQVVFTPFDQWRQRLRYIAFIPATRHAYA